MEVLFFVLTLYLCEAIQNYIYYSLVLIIGIHLVQDGALFLIMLSFADHFEKLTDLFS